MWQAKYEKQKVKAAMLKVKQQKEFNCLNRKQLQVQHPLQKAEDPRGASKHGDMLDHKQGRDVGP